MFIDLGSVYFIRINKLKWMDNVKKNMKKNIYLIINQMEIDSEVDPGIVGETVYKMI